MNNLTISKLAQIIDEYGLSDNLAMRDYLNRLEDRKDINNLVNVEFGFVDLIEGVNGSVDYSDVYILSAEWENGEELTDEEIAEFSPSDVYDLYVSKYCY